MELEPAAAELVGSRLGLHRDDARRGLTELGVVVLRRDLRFANRFEVWIDDDDSKNRVAVLGSVQLIRRSAEMLTVHHRLRRTLRVLARGVVPLELLRARGEQEELGEVAIQDRQFGDLFRVEACGDVSAVGLEDG